MEFIPVIHSWFKNANQINIICHIRSIKRRNHMVSSAKRGNIYPKLTFIHWQSQWRTNRNCLNLMFKKSVCEKIIANTMFNGKTSILPCHRHSWGGQGCPFSVCLSDTCMIRGSAEGRTEKDRCKEWRAGREAETKIDGSKRKWNLIASLLGPRRRLSS